MKTARRHAAKLDAAIIANLFTRRTGSETAKPDEASLPVAVVRSALPCGLYRGTR